MKKERRSVVKAIFQPLPPLINHQVRRKNMHLRNGIVTSIVCLLLVLAIFPISAEGKKYGKLYLREYQAKDADEAAILDTLIQYEKAFNSHDLEKLDLFFEKDAVYHPCGISNKYPISSGDCQKRLKVNFALYRFETYYDPEISVNGSEAVVKLLLETGSYLADYTFSLKKESQGWLVAAADYTNDHDKP
jgi:hypothetical protein